MSDAPARSLPPVHHGRLRLSTLRMPIERGFAARRHRLRHAGADTPTLTSRWKSTVADHGARGNVGDARRDRSRGDARSSARPIRSNRSALAACASSKSRANAAIRPHARRRSRPACGAHAERPPAGVAAQCDGALHLRSPARLPDVPRQRRLRTAGHGRCRRPARSALRLRRREITCRTSRTNRIRTSPTIRPNASSATAACAPAKRRKARSR